MVERRAGERGKDAVSRDLLLIREAVALGRALEAAPTADEALREAADFLSGAFDAPVAVWRAVDETSDLPLLLVRGIGGRPYAELQLAMRSIPRPGSWTPRKRGVVTRSFARVVGHRVAEVAVLGDAVVLIGEGAAEGAALGIVAEMLGDSLSRREGRGPVAGGGGRRELGLAWAAHELRSPLLGVKAALETVLSDDSWTERSWRLLASSLREVEQVSGVIDDLLGWAAWGMALKRREVDLASLIDDVVGQVGSEPGDRLVVDAPTAAMAFVDAVHLRTAVANVVRNALTYSPPETKVSVRLEAREGWIELAVHNEGPPIPSLEGESVFEPLVRRDAEGRNPAGKGLGLYIARRVVDAHGGHIWYESGDGGTTFTIRLPENMEQRTEAGPSALAWPGS